MYPFPPGGRSKKRSDDGIPKAAPAIKRSHLFIHMHRRAPPRWAEMTKLSGYQRMKPFFLFPAPPYGFLVAAETVFRVLSRRKVRVQFERDGGSVRIEIIHHLRDARTARDAFQIRKDEFAGPFPLLGIASFFQVFRYSLFSGFNLAACPTYSGSQGV